MSLSSNSKGAASDSLTKVRYGTVRTAGDKFCSKTYLCCSVSFRIVFHYDLQALKILKRYLNAIGIFWNPHIPPERRRLHSFLFIFLECLLSRKNLRFQYCLRETDYCLTAEKLFLYGAASGRASDEKAAAGSCRSVASGHPNLQNHAASPNPNLQLVMVPH